MPGWQVVLAEVNSAADARESAFVIQATPDRLPVSIEEVSHLRERLFLLLSFAAGKEIGLGPDVGLDGSRQVVWATWGAPRYSTREPGRTWCPDNIYNEALPMLARGLSDLADKPTLEKAVLRAIDYLLAAQGHQPLDVRLPVACSGLELMGWAVLQHFGWATADTLGRLSAAATATLLLQWARIPTSIQPDQKALIGRQTRVGQRDWRGPDVIFNVRNGLVHPPKKFDAPEWPMGKEVDQALTLALSYLETTILRALSYAGKYSNRLSTKWLGQTESVPWSSV
ncbi:hypothetical protein KRMM14A1004_16130 [Krasilnikovia sp. MM14-A1004]